MRPELPLRSGDAMDAFSRWRRLLAVFHNRTGLVKRQQRAYWKRVRRYWNKQLREQL
jgi:hypothetical protein